ncbi:unnamed protein product [Cladocopium goreaui]|uniref:Vacuolar protein sorting-associated protein 13C n=1 Tax=Cladocopium goreaui TaxID=2562237 RepID=A0A9P1D4T5_9DINO|nr:unnamed protein product [Cladocopium goreaui]
MESICEGRHFAWAKVALFSWLFTPHRCSSACHRVFGRWLQEEERKALLKSVDYLVWIDGDAMVLDHGRALKDFVAGRFRRKALVLAEDMSWADCLNTGVFFARTDSDWLSSLWADTWNGSHQRFHQAPFWDQSGLCQELAKRREFLPQVLGAMPTGLSAKTPWFSWMGGPHLKETPQLGIWDSASLQFANPLHAQFILHLCGFSAKLKLCRSLCCNGVLRNFRLSTDESVEQHPTASSNPLWKAAVLLLDGCSEMAVGWNACGPGDGHAEGGCLQPSALPTPEELSWNALRWRWGHTPVSVECIDADIPTAEGAVSRAALWQVIDYVRGFPPPCHPLLGKLSKEMFCTRWIFPEGGELHLYPPGARVQFDTGSIGPLFLWVLSGQMECSSACCSGKLRAGQQLPLQHGEVFTCTALAPTAAMCRSSSSPPSPLGQLLPVSGACAPSMGWQWFGHPENWLGAPKGHEPVDQVALAKQKEMQKLLPYAKVR